MLKPMAFFVSVVGGGFVVFFSFFLRPQFVKACLTLSKLFFHVNLNASIYILKVRHVIKYLLQKKLYV